MMRIAAITLVVLAFSSSVQGADEAAGLKGTIYRVDKNKENIDDEVKLAVKVGDIIELQWSYPVEPGALPTGVEGKSHSDAVKYEDARTVISQPRLVETRRVAGRFTAVKEGKATISLTVKAKANTTVVKIDVEVKN